MGKEESQDAVVYGPPQERRRADAEAVAEAHQRDLEVQGKYGVKYYRYWYDEDSDEVFCLYEVSSLEAAEAVHREAHELVADEVIEVKEDS